MCTIMYDLEFEFIVFVLVFMVDWIEVKTRWRATDSIGNSIGIVE
jgi:hypothetical protein